MRSVHAFDTLPWRGYITPLLGLCPLLALAPDAARALALAFAIVLTTLLTLPWWALRHRVPPAVRWPTAVLSLAAATGVTQLLLDASNHGLHPLTALGVPMVAATVGLLFCAGGLAGNETAAIDSLGILGRAFAAAAALLLLGVLRELFAQGTVFASAGEYFGNDFATWSLRWSTTHHGLLLFAQPAGALFALACLLAGAQAWRLRQKSSTYTA